MPLSFRYRSYRMLHKKLLDGIWESDTVGGKTNSLDRNRYGQVLSSGTLFVEIYPMARKSYAGIALKTLITDIVFPERLTIDGSKNYNAPGTEFMKICRRNDIQVTRTEPEHPNQNPAETVIQ